MEIAPKREYFLEFVARHGTMSRTRFLDRITTPVLLLTSEASASASFDATETGAGMLRPPAEGTPPPVPAELPFFLYMVDKREGANTTPAVTVGRAETNDIVIPDPGISRIHAAFFKQESAWTIADASSLGTWVGGTKLQPKKHHPLGATALLKLGPAVFATFMMPDKLFDLVAKTLPR